MVKYLRLSWENDANIPVLLVSFKPIGMKLLNSENLEGTFSKTYLLILDTSMYRDMSPSISHKFSASLHRDTSTEELIDCVISSTIIGYDQTQILFSGVLV